MKQTPSKLCEINTDIFFRDSELRFDMSSENFTFFLEFYQSGILQNFVFVYFLLIYLFIYLLVYLLVFMLAYMYLFILVICLLTSFVYQS